MSETTESKSSSFELRDYFRILWLRKWTAILVVTLVVTGALFISYQQVPVYQSQATVLIPPPPPEVSGGSTITRLDISTESQLATSTLMGFYAAELLTKGSIPGAVTAKGAADSSDSSTSQKPKDKSNPTPTPTESPFPAQATDLSPAQIEEGIAFLHGVGVQPARQSQLLLFMQVKDPSAQHAADKANALALGYLTFKRNQAVASLTTAKGNLQTQVADLEAQIIDLSSDPSQASKLGNTQAQLSNIENQLKDLNQSIKDARRAGDVPNPAVAPKRPFRPNHVRDGAFAFIVGLILGFGASFLRDYVDDSLRGTEDVERQSGAPLIGVVPHVAAAREIVDASNGSRRYLVTREDPKAPASEAYRGLRTNLLFMAVSGPMGRLVLTSPVAGEGKSTTASNLAVVFAQAGQRVLLVGSDLRRPSVHRFFGMSNRVGLSSVLAGQASLAEAVVDPGIKGLRVMASGPVPPNPTELLGSLAMREFLEQAAQVTDWVILDAPPILGLADAAVLATLSDAALMVVNETTNRRVLAHARDQLAKVRARVVGTVLNNFGPAFSYYYSDYYAYTSQYYLQDQEQERESGDGKLSRKERKRQQKAGRPDREGADAPPPPIPAATPVRREPDVSLGTENGGQQRSGWSEGEAWPPEERVSQ